MSNLISTMVGAANALDAFNQALNVVQNNVANAGTPNYATQTQDFTPLQFDPAQGFTGGVAAGQVVSSRNQYAEQAVEQQSSLLGQAQQDVTSLTAIQNEFDVTGTSGIATAFNNLFSAFSAWAQTPTDAEAQQNVIQQASAVAEAFQQTATGLSTVATDSGQQLTQTVASVNSLTTQLAQLNQQIMSGGQNDPALDAEVHQTLDQLSNDASITATQQSDGTWTVLLNGQTPLVMDNRSYALSAVPNPSDPAHTSLLAAGASDITAQTTSGQLGSLLNTVNVVLPGYLGDQGQQGSLNTLAQSFADTVNSLLTNGYQNDGPPPVAGVPLFTYNAGAPTDAAASLAVSSTIQAGQLAAISPGPPEVSNGVALALAGLADPTGSTGEIGGLSYTQYYAGMAANVGTLLDNANSRLTMQQSAVAQAQNVVQQVSGVSLDQEAMLLVQFQQSYDANSKLITVLDQLTEDTMNMLPTGS